ncbi:MAG: type IV secretion system protein [Alphaproteobacteria bacterium]|nr:type IV secretion system protein [Alphaproteobacteria bacterium]
MPRPNARPGLKKEAPQQQSQVKEEVVEKKHVAKKQVNSATQEELSVDLLRERRYLWTARAFSIVSAVALCVNLILLIAILNLMPLKRVEPFLLTFQNKDDQVVNMRPLAKDLAADAIITEAMIRQYVLLYHTMTSNVEEMAYRWGTDGPIYWMSTQRLYKDFSKNIRDRMTQIKVEGLTREVRIENVIQDQNMWIVHFRTQDMKPEADQPESQRWRANVRIRYLVNHPGYKVKYADRLKNPLGFKVVEYGVESYND